MPPVTGSVEKKLYNVLLTGFGPFDTYKVNPAWLTVSALHATTVETDTHIVSFTAFQVPTAYAAILALVPPLHARPPVLPSTQYPRSPTALDGLPDPDGPASQPMPAPPLGGYDLILHVGAGRRGYIALETQGHKSGYVLVDVDDKLPPVVEGGDGSQKESIRGFSKGYEELADCLVTSGDVPALVEYLKSTGIEHVRVSHDAGYYCCDFIYYCSLAESVRNKSNHQTLVQFMHIPPPGEPYPVETFTEAAKAVAMFYVSSTRV